MKSKGPNSLATALRRYFSDYLPRVRGVSPHTVHSYRDALALLLRFLAKRHDRPVIDLDIDSLDSDSVLAYLDYLEEERSNSTTHSNCATRSFAFVRRASPRPESRVSGDLSATACRSVSSARFAGGRVS